MGQSAHTGDGHQASAHRASSSDRRQALLDRSNLALDPLAHAQQCQDRFLETELTGHKLAHARREALLTDRADEASEGLGVT
jgi:hypothetical protein